MKRGLLIGLLIALFGRAAHAGVMYSNLQMTANSHADFNPKANAVDATPGAFSENNMPTAVVVSAPVIGQTYTQHAEIQDTRSFDSSAGIFTLTASTNITDDAVIQANGSFGLTGTSKFNGSVGLLGGFAVHTQSTATTAFTIMLDVPTILRTILTGSAADTESFSLDQSGMHLYIINRFANLGSDVMTPTGHSAPNSVNPIMVDMPLQPGTYVVTFVHTANDPGNPNQQGTVGLSMTMVPEPAMPGMLLAGAAAMLRRRR